MSLDILSYDDPKQLQLLNLYFPPDYIVRYPTTIASPIGRVVFTGYLSTSSAYIMIGDLLNREKVKLQILGLDSLWKDTGVYAITRRLSGGGADGTTGDGFFEGSISITNPPSNAGTWQFRFLYEGNPAKQMGPATSAAFTITVTGTNLANDVQTWRWEAETPTWSRDSALQPPTMDEVRQRFTTDGRLADAMGEFVVNMLDQGYAVTLYGYSVDAFIDYKDTDSYLELSYWATRIRLTAVFIAVPSLQRRFVIITLTAATIIAIGAAIAIIIAGIGIYYALQNLTSTSKTVDTYGWVLNPDTGQYEWRKTGSTTETGPPAWWQNVVIVGELTIILVGAAIGYSYLGKRR